MDDGKIRFRGGSCALCELSIELLIYLINDILTRKKNEEVHSRQTAMSEYFSVRRSDRKCKSAIQVSPIFYVNQMSK